MIGLAAAALAALPAASAHANATISVNGDAISYVGDDGPNRLEVLPVQDGEQHFDESDLTPGPGCHTVSPTPNSGAAQVAGGALAKATFKLRGNQARTLKVHLSKKSAKRLRKLHQTTLEARTTFTSGGHAYSVTRGFLVKPR